MEWIDSLLSQAMSAINQANIGAIIALFFIVALTEMGVPFPFILDATIFYTSYKAGIISAQVGLVFLVVILGRQFGAGTLYWLTRLPGNAFVNWLGRRYPAIPRNLAKFDSKLGKQAIWAIAIGRLTGLLTVVSIASGALGIRYHNLVLGVVISSLIFDGALIILGSGAGLFLPNVPPWTIVIGLSVALGCIWGGHFLWVSRKSRAETKKSD